jgi:hypothetical protein
MSAPTSVSLRLPAATSSVARAAAGPLSGSFHPPGAVPPAQPPASSPSASAPSRNPRSFSADARQRRRNRRRHHHHCRHAPSNRARQRIPDPQAAATDCTSSNQPSPRPARPGTLRCARSSTAAHSAPEHRQQNRTATSGPVGDTDEPGQPPTVPTPSQQRTDRR